MSDLVPMYLRGAIVRMSGLVPVVAIGFIAPIAFGANVYGACVAIMCIPFAIQGLIEPTVTSMLIKHIGTRAGRECLSVLFKLIGLLFIAGLITLYIVVNTLGEIDNTLLVFSLSSTFTAIYLFNTTLMGISYAQSNSALVVRANSISGVVFVAASLLLRENGVMGYFITVLLWQITQAYTYYNCRDVIKYYFFIQLTRSVLIKRTISHEIMPAMASRMSLVCMNTLSVLWVAYMSSPAETTAFKVTMTLAGMQKFILPLSPEIIQMHVNAGIACNSIQKKKIIVSMLCILMIGVLISILTIPLINIIRQVLTSDPNIYSNVNYLIYGSSFLCFMTPLSGYVYANGHVRMLLLSSVLSVVVFSVLCMLKLTPIGVFMGSFVYVAILMVNELFFSTPKVIHERSSRVPSAA